MVLYETAGDEQLVLTAHLWFSEQLKDCDLINNYCAMGGGALDALATPLTHDHDSEI
jgi:hypothetical protein